MKTNNATCNSLSLVRNLLATLSPEMLSISLPLLKKQGLLRLRDNKYKTIGEFLNKLINFKGVMNRPYIQALNDIAVIVARLAETSGQTELQLISNNNQQAA